MSRPAYKQVSGLPTMKGNSMQLQVVPPIQGSIASSTIAVNTTDAMLIELWLADKTPNTKHGYAIDIAQFRDFTVHKPLSAITYNDLVDYATYLNASYSHTSFNRKLASIKSLFNFGKLTGYLTLNVPAAYKLKRPTNTLAQRILPKETIYKIIAFTEHPRDYVILRVLYKTGIRANELCTLQWADCSARDIGGQVTVHGKGNKTRTITIKSDDLWQELMALAHTSQYVFTAEQTNGRPGQGYLSYNRVYTICKEAGERVGLRNITPHFFRHAHASHALDNHIPAHVVQHSMGHTSLETTTRYAHARPDVCSSDGIDI